jgi:HlyD family secretion protein
MIVREEIKGGDLMSNKRKKKKKYPWLIAVILVLVSVAVYFRFIRSVKDDGVSFVTAALSVMDIESLVSSTGTLSAVGTLEIGTQVSGKLDSVLVDFNDSVKEGEILAILDRTTLKSTYRDAVSSLKRSRAQYELMQEKFANDSNLYDRGLISSYEYKSSNTELVASESNFISAEIALEKADQNLNEYAIIRSPIDGMVLSREVEAGQTVQASMSAPTLFILAKDLRNMEIEALVDESDISSIEQGQDIRFTVDAYPEREFKGKVKQRRLQPTVISDIVHYTVVCSAENSEGILLPGMTATIEFIISYRDQVLAVPNSAFSVQMPAEFMEAASARALAGGGRSKKTVPKTAANMGRLWYKSEDGSLGMAIVEKGLSDGMNTEIVRTGKLPENALIITRVRTNGTGSATTTNQMRGGGMPRGPGIF